MSRGLSPPLISRSGPKSESVSVHPDPCLAMSVHQHKQSLGHVFELGRQLGRQWLTAGCAETFWLLFFSKVPGQESCKNVGERLAT